MDESWEKLVFSFSEFSIYAHAALVLACIAATLIAHKIHGKHESAHAALVLASGMLTLGQPASCERSYATIS